MRLMRRSPQTTQVAQALLRHPAEWRYGYDLSRETGLKSGTLYPILMRLAGKSLLETRWEEPTGGGRPPRHMYKLSADGMRWAREDAVVARTGHALKPAYGERNG